MKKEQKLDDIIEKAIKENAELLKKLSETDKKDAETFDKLCKSDDSLEDLKK